MKKLFLVVVCATALITANAQARFGIKAGANFATVTDDDAAKMKVGINGGVQAHVSISSMFSFNPEAVYSSQGAKGDGDVTMNLNYINLPLLLQWNHASGLFINSGPQVGFLMSAKMKSGGESLDIKESVNSTDFAWAI